MQAMHIDPHLVEVKNPLRYTMYLEDYHPGHIFVWDDKISVYDIPITHFENQKIGRKVPRRELSDILVKDKFLTLNGNRLKS